MRFSSLLCCRATKTQASLHIRAVLPEPSLLTYTKYGRRLNLRTKFRYIYLSSVLAAINADHYASNPSKYVSMGGFGGFCANVILQ